jgi:Zn-dependent protease with chaperone function
MHTSIWLQSLFKALNFALSCLLTCLISTMISEGSLAGDKQLSADDTASWNLFSVEQDTQLGKESASRFEEAVQLVQNPKLNNYFSRLGNQLASALPQTRFPFSFKLIADGSLHAFSFPGGPVYCTAGMMAVAKSEAQLAGLLAHQMAHIILRDTTSIASRMKRFRVRAAMAAAATGEKSLLDSLEEIDLYLMPSSELMHFDLKSERRAAILAAKLMTTAGFAPLEAWAFFQNLQINHKQAAESYLVRHPYLKLGSPETSQGLQRKQFRLVSKYKFRRLRNKAGAIQAKNEHLEALVNWHPPERDHVASAGPRIIYLSGSYSFSYPASWKGVNSTGTDKFQATPKGGDLRLANGERMVVTGVSSGTLELGDQASSDNTRLLNLVKEIRPGLTLVREPEHLPVASRLLEGMVLEGLSPVSGKREMVWVVSARLTDRTFYLLMVAPEKNFARMQPEFDAILKSIEFYEHPVSGQLGVRSQDGAVIRPQAIE